MKLSKNLFGVLSTGEEVYTYTLENKNGMQITVLEYGAIIQKIIVPDKNGKMADVALGYDTLEDYLVNGPAHGAVVGRHANRIKDGIFTLNGITYQLEKNDRGNNLHSAEPAYKKMMYKTDIFEGDDRYSIEFSRTSPDMEQGFPGKFAYSVTYSLTENNGLVIEYRGISDKDTIVNLTNHCYFNLAGHNSGSILDHQVWLNASRFTPTDDTMIPTGEYADVTGTPMDFRVMKKIGQDIEADYKPLLQGGGYDHNYVLDIDGKSIELVGKLWDEESGRLMEVYTDCPGLQLYSANFLAGEPGSENTKPSKDGVVYKNRDAVCFETQYFPNACNTPSFPSSILKAKEEYKFTTEYRFTIQ